MPRTDLPASPQAKLAAFRSILREMGSVVVAYSGGIDSALVLRVASETLGDRALGLTAVGPALAPSEREAAMRSAAEMGARHLLVDSKEIEDPNYRKNPTDRCYFCKSELYRITEARRRDLGFEWVANGTNADDLDDHRPGLAAAEEARVRSPLLEARIGKQDVRDMAQLLGMSTWDKPASACLASRIPYGTEVTPERLSRIGRLEGALRELGLRQVRARFHGETVRVEVAREELERAFILRERIVEVGRAEGFAYVTLDLEGYRTGSLNVLGERS